ncbi:MAG: ROK family protein [Armatimonadota bacterium]
MATDSYLLGYDIGGTKSAVVLGRTESDRVEIIDKIAFPTLTSEGVEQTLVQFEQQTQQILERHKLQIGQMKGIGISCGGPLDGKTGVILGPPNLPGWDKVPIVSRFERRYGLPVYLVNDANACALAEWKWGAGKGCQNMVFMTFGTGLGAGLILDGKLYSGTNDMAGEAGHIRLAKQGPVGYGKEGSFEGFCSGGGIARLAQAHVKKMLERGEPVPFCPSLGGLSQLTAQSVAEAARTGDPVATDIYNTVARKLGEGLSILIDLLNPECIVIGSVFVRQHELLWPIAAQTIAEEALTLSASVCRVVPAALGEAIGDYASLCVALGEGF